MTRALRAVGRWVTDWRNGATIIGTILAVLLAFTVVGNSQGRDRALGALKAQSATQLSAQKASTARITELRTQIAGLEGSAAANGQRIGELVAEVHVLESQVRAMGGQPVVTEPATTRPTLAATTTTSTTSPGQQPPPTTTTTTVTVPPTTTTTVASQRCIIPNVPPGCRP